MEVAKLVKIAIENKDIAEATLTKEYSFSTLNGKIKKVESTDNLLKIFPQNGITLMGGKTGYTEAAGYCFAGKFIDKNNHEIVSVVLNSKSNEGRFEETNKIAEWVYKNYEWQQ